MFFSPCLFFPLVFPPPPPPFLFDFLFFSSISSLAATLSKCFDTPSDEGWGLYETAGKGGLQTERWLDPRFALSWYLPVGTLEWKEKVKR